MSDTHTHLGAPIVCPVQQVEPAWIDYNGHMNMAFYHLAFDRALDHVYDLLGIGRAYTAAGQRLLLHAGGARDVPAGGGPGIRRKL